MPAETTRARHPGDWARGGLTSTTLPDWYGVSAGDDPSERCHASGADRWADALADTDGQRRGPGQRSPWSRLATTRPPPPETAQRRELGKIGAGPGRGRPVWRDCAGKTIGAGERQVGPTIAVTRESLLSSVVGAVSTSSPSRITATSSQTSKTSSRWCEMYSTATRPRPALVRGRTAAERARSSAAVGSSSSSAPRPGCQRPSDLDDLALLDRQRRAGRPVDVEAPIGAGSLVCRASSASRRPARGGLMAEEDVLGDGEVRHDHRVLENGGEPAVPRVGCWRAPERASRRSEPARSGAKMPRIETSVDLPAPLRPTSPGSAPAGWRDRRREGPACCRTAC